MYDLKKFTIADMTECNAAMRKLGQGVESMEESATKLVHYLYDNLIDSETKSKACALVRFFKTQAYGKLDSELRSYANRLLAQNTASPSMKCLTLIATVGEKPEWNSRKTSNGHKAIPLPSKEIVAQAPMISNLIRQLGLEIETVLSPDPKLLIDLGQKTFNVFHVPEAAGSPFIPAQKEFVVPMKIKSVLGWGGLLPTGDLFAVIMFTKVLVPRETAEMFKSLALAAKMAVMPFEEKIFA